MILSNSVNNIDTNTVDNTDVVTRVTPEADQDKIEMVSCNHTNNGDYGSNDIDDAKSSTSTCTSEARALVSEQVVFRLTK